MGSFNQNVPLSKVFSTILAFCVALGFGFWRMKRNEARKEIYQVMQKHATILPKAERLHPESAIKNAQGVQAIILLKERTDFISREIGAMSTSMGNCPDDFTYCFQQYRRAICELEEAVNNLHKVATSKKVKPEKLQNAMEEAAEAEKAGKNAWEKVVASAKKYGLKVQ